MGTGFDTGYSSKHHQAFYNPRCCLTPEFKWGAIICQVAALVPDERCLILFKKNSCINYQNTQLFIRDQCCHQAVMAPLSNWCIQHDNDAGPVKFNFSDWSFQKKHVNNFTNRFALCGVKIQWILSAWAFKNSKGTKWINAHTVLFSSNYQPLLMLCSCTCLSEI